MSLKNLPTLQQFIDALDDHIWVKNTEGQYVAVNEASESAWHYSREHIFGKTDNQLFSPDRAEFFKLIDEKVISKGSQQTVEECAALDRNGNEVWLETIKSPIKNECGDLVGIIGMTRNATRRKQVEARLSLTSEIFNNFQEGMMITDHKATSWILTVHLLTLLAMKKLRLLGETRVF